MTIIEGIDQIEPISNAIVTIGTFDGVHVGHQEILQKIVNKAKKANGNSVVLTFWPHPRFILYPEDQTLKLLTSFEEKAAIMEKVGINFIIKIEFTKQFSEFTSEAFVKQILKDKIGAKRLIIGYDHRFGKNRDGSFDYLKQNESRFDLEVEEITKQEVDDVAVSSTKIRSALNEGQVELADEYMGRPYSMAGTVIEGAKIGTSIGYPTANIRLNAAYKLLPKNGVYAVRVKKNDVLLDAMLNIGVRPTVSNSPDQRVIEAHIFDFNEDIYGEELTVIFVKRLRSEQKFESLDKLKNQLERDKEESLSILRK